MYKKVFTFIKNKIGPLGWSAMLVFVASRFIDFTNLACRLFVAKNVSVDFGIFDPFFVLITFIIIPISAIRMVFAKSISRLTALNKVAESRWLFALLLKLSLLYTIASSVIVWFFRHPLLARLKVSDRYIYVLLASLFISILYPLCLSVFQGKKRYGVFVLYSIIYSLLMLGSNYFLVSTYNLGIMGALWARVIPGIVTLFLFISLIRPAWDGEKKIDKNEWLIIKRMIIPIFVYMAIVNLLDKVNFLFVRNFIENDSAGYGALYTWGMIPYYAISPIVFVLFPLAASEHASGKNVIRYLKQALLLGLVLLGVFVFIFYFFSDFLMGLQNTLFLPYSRYLWVFGLAMGINCLIQIIANYQMAHSRYLFLIFMGIPVLLMCLSLYFMRSILSISIVLWVNVVTHITVLFLILPLALFPKKE